MNKNNEGYIYLVKNPSTSEVTVCAWDTVLYPGMYVVYPTRFGLDMGLVIGTAGDLGNAPKSPSCTKVCGACTFGKVSPDSDEDLIAWADPKDYGFKSVAYEDLLPLPKEEFIDDSECWDHGSPEPQKAELSGDIVCIERLANPEDLRRYQSNCEKEESALVECRAKIIKHNLNMKLVCAHFVLAEQKALFFFTADERVDFRDLVKDLVSIFKLRIELRQIGVRDESRFIGGLSVCGRDFCCHCVSDKMEPVSIKMAKEQNMSLNSMKISGPCGRLLCCLAFENSFYTEEKLNYPSENSRIRFQGELWKVSEVNILTKRISITDADGRMIWVPRSELDYNAGSSYWEISKKFQEEFL